jgi:hypothetical protein
MKVTKASEIFHTICTYFDIKPRGKEVERCIIKIQEIVDRKCKHSVAAERNGTGPWKYIFNQDEGFKCGSCGIPLKVKEWEEVK